MALIFDTETTGLPICPGYGAFHKYSELQYYDRCRVIQISYIITDSDFMKLEESDTVIKTDNFTIENSQFHGVTNERSQSEGIPFMEFAKQFGNALDFVDCIIAHNIQFDLNVLASELHRYSQFDVLEKFLSKRQICTMNYTKYIINSKFKSGTGIKDPNLRELYFYCTGKELKNHHNSMYDTLNLLECVQVLHKKKLL
jgi:DNA polymerase-3 subunit alpha